MREGGKFLGVYRAVVVDTNDPLEHARVQVMVPSVLAEEHVWALTLRQARTSSLPLQSGDEVIVAFEAGDVDYPVLLGML